MRWRVGQAHGRTLNEGALVSENEETAGRETPVPSGNSDGLDTEPLRPRRAGVAKTAAAFGGAVTSRTAGWMVAAALAGSLVTLGIDHGTSQPSAGSITVRNAGRVAQAPTGAGKHARIQAVPGQKRIYVAPGGPLGAGSFSAQGRTSWIMQQPCAAAGVGGPPFSARHQRFNWIQVPKRVVIGPRGQRKLHVQIGQMPARKAIRIARPACPMFPIHCQASITIGGQAPPFTRGWIERRGHVYVIGPQQGSMRRMTINAPAFRRTVVVVPSPRIEASQGRQCVAFLRPQQ
jgi:hypothetical protein